MTEETNNLVLEHLRHICGALDSLHADMREFLDHPGLPNLPMPQASQDIELDHTKERLDRIERRLELNDS